MASVETKARVALVTGGASGIGLAAVECLLASGWKVAIADRDETAREGQCKLTARTPRLLRHLSR